MCEIELLRQFRSGASGHDPELARARSALTDAIETETFKLPGAIRRPFPRLGIPRARVAVVGAGAFLLLVAASAISLWLPADRGGPNSAVAALEEVAAVAGEQPVQSPPGSGEYLYTKSISNKTLLVGEEGGTLIPDQRTEEIWVGPDHSGRLRSTSNPRFPEAGPGDSEATSFSTRHPAGFLTYDDLSDLPTDPGTLERRIAKHEILETLPSARTTFSVLHDSPATTFDIARDLLGTQRYAPPEVRKALYEVIARQPSVELLGHVTDPVGRPGVAVAVTSQGIRRELVFDPDTSSFLAQRDVILDPRAAKVDVQPGTVSYTAYLGSGVVDSTDATPSVGGAPTGADR